MEVKIQNVTKRYGSVIALSNADFELHSGEIRALVGGNGSGKSTVSKILTGIASRDTGDILIDGKSYDAGSPREGKDNGIVMTSQELSLLPNLTVAENICLCNMDARGKLKFVDKKAMERRARELLKEVNKEDIMNMEINDLPANEQYLVEFVKALAQSPKVLIVDEITSALYKADVDAVIRIMNRLKEEGVITLFISHRLNEVLTMCDTVTVLRNGDTIGTFNTKDLDENKLISYMSGREIEDVEVSAHKDVSTAKVVLDTGDVHLKRFKTTARLEAREGEFIGVAGLDGQGQKEFLRALFAMNGPINLKFKGEDLHLKHPRDAVEKGFAFISGDREREGTFKERSIAENANAVNSLVLKNKIEDIDAFLKKNGVKYGKSSDLITSLSGGNQQKVVISRWTATNPQLILADDPTKGIDIQARRDVHNTMRLLLEEGNSVIMISSDDEELVETANMMPLGRIIVFYEGEIVATLSGDAINVENISAASSGKTLIRS